MRLHYLDNRIQVLYRLVMLFWRGWRYTIDVLYRLCVSPLACGGGDRSPLFTIISAEKYIESGSLSDILFKDGRLCQKGDPFVNHHRVVNCLTSRTCKFSPLFQFIDKTG